MNELFNTTYYLFSIAAVIIVVIIAYYTTLIIAKKTNRLMKNKHSKVLEKTALGLNMSIIVIQVNNKVYILLQHYKEIELLDVVDEQNWSNYRGSDISDTNNPFNGQALEKVMKIKNMLVSKRDDMKGENDKTNNE